MSTKRQYSKLTLGLRVKRSIISFVSSMILLHYSLLYKQDLPPLNTETRVCNFCGVGCCIPFDPCMQVNRKGQV